MCSCVLSGTTKLPGVAGGVAVGLGDTVEALTNDWGTRLAALVVEADRVGTGIEMLHHSGTNLCDYPCHTGGVGVRERRLLHVEVFCAESTRATAFACVIAWVERASVIFAILLGVVRADHHDPVLGLEVVDEVALGVRADLAEVRLCLANLLLAVERSPVSGVA